MYRHGAGRKGNALIEVLLVVTIIAMMLGLMLPAMTRSREAARRSQCINSLRQIMLATQNYEYVNQVLPPGVVDEKGPIDNQGNGLHIGWIMQLLPFMEQQRLYESIDFEVPIDAPENVTVSQTKISTLLCPSDPQAGISWVRPVSSFAGCHHDVEAPIDVDNHGVFFLNSRIRREDVHDGTSCTIFVSEKRIAPNRDHGWMSGTRATLRNTGAPINTTVEPIDNQVGGYGSYHPGGANFGFGDGSVRWLSERINLGVYHLLGHRDDGEPIEEKTY